MFVNPRLSSESIHALYDQAYFQGEGFDGSVAYAEQAESGEVAEDANRALRRIASKYSAPASMLEIGPGMGGLMKLAVDAGYKVQGLELSEFAVKSLKAQGLDVRQGVLPDTSIADNSFDVVVAIEVIEHLTDPMTFFREVQRILKPGGMFYYETGNVACEQAQTLKADWDYIMPEGHLYYFSPHSMKGYLEKAGLAASYPNWSPPARTAFRLLHKLGLTDDDEILPQGLRGLISRQLLKLWDGWNGANDAFPVGIKR